MATTQVQTIVPELDRKIDFLYQALNDRLELKDRWISTLNADVEDRIANESLRLIDRIVAVNDRVASELLSLQRMIDSNMQHAQQYNEVVAKDHDHRMSELREDYLRQIANEKHERESSMLAYKEAHTILHDASKTANDDFRLSVQKQLEVLQKNIDQLKEERGLFVLRDAIDAKLDALEKSVAAYEKVSREQVEITAKTLKESQEEKAIQVADRIAKIENSI